jgi:hypothetical protein
VGTIARIIERFDDVIYRDINFAAQAPGTTIFKESSTNATNVTLLGAGYSYGTPGTQAGVSSNLTLSANRDYPHMFFVYKKILVDMVHFTVTTGPSSSGTVRCGLYAADSDFQPTGSPIINSSSVTVAASTAGVATYYVEVTPVILEPGAYIAVINLSQNMGFRFVRAGIAMMPGDTDSIAYASYASRTHGAFPDPGVKWNIIQGADGAGFMQKFFLRWSEV